MKRLFLIIGCTVLLAFVPLSSVWAVWEGNAGIGAASEFPGSGLYAKSDMFPKNTVVEIENLETEITVRAIITGTSGVPGLVAVLSPETAAALNIRIGSVSRVRISVPSVIEKSVPGTATESARTTALDPDINPAEATTSALGNSANASIPLVGAAPPETSPLAEATPVEAPVIPLEAIAASPEDPLVSLADVPASVPTPEPTAEPEPTTASVETVEPTATTETEPTAEPEADTASVATVEPSMNEEPESFANEPELTSGSVTVSDAVPVSSGEADVTLVPAEPRPPEVPSTLEEVPIADILTVAPVATAPAATSPAAPAEPLVAPVVVAAVQKPVVISSSSVSDLPVIQTLVKGSYYIQIATMSDVVNVRNICNSYGKKYPIAIEKTSNKNGDIMKVYIGPIQKDEYGAVLERFQKLGFKDAFVKKGQ